MVSPKTKEPTVLPLISVDVAKKNVAELLKFISSNDVSTILTKLPKPKGVVELGSIMVFKVIVVNTCISYFMYTL